MSKQEKEKMLELLSDKAIFGLSEQEFADFAELEKNFPELSDDSLESTAAAIGTPVTTGSASAPSMANR